MGWEALCCGGGLSGNCLQIIHFIFWFLTIPKSPPNPIFCHFPKILNIFLPSLCSWRYCVVVEWDLAAKPREIQTFYSHSLFWITAPPPKLKWCTNTIPPATQATPSLNFIHVKHPKIVEKLINNYRIKDCNWIESFLDWMESWLDIYEKGSKSTKNNAFNRIAFLKPLKTWQARRYQNLVKVGVEMTACDHGRMTFSW